MDWIQFATFLIANTVFTLTLWLWARTESRTDHREIVSLVNAIQLEMKDFHGKLERQDAEFKAHLMYQHKAGK